MYKFASAANDETTVFGAAKPRYTQESVKQWIKFVQSKKIEKVCCLLDRNCLSHYPLDLLEVYNQEFASECVLWQPIKDFHIPPAEVLIEAIIPFLISAEKKQQKIIC